MRRGHIPIRLCLVCGKKNSKFALRRVALSPVDKLIVLDPEQFLKGRGAYVCQGCLPRLGYTKRVQKAFREQSKGLAESIGG